MLKARIFTALALLAGLLIVLFRLPVGLAALLFVVITALAAWEWAGLLMIDPLLRRIYAASMAVACFAIWMTGAAMTLLLWYVAGLFWLLLVPLWLWRGWSLRTFGSVPAGFLGFVLLLPTWAALIFLLARGPWFFLAILGAIWVADIAAYIAGRTFGRHKLAPSISPGKTWEGVAGAVIAVMIYGFIVAPALPGLQAVGPGMLAFGLLLLTALSILGDLFESLAKRQAGVKDSSHLLPGHGGVLDRIDSLTATLPVLALAVRAVGS